MIWSDSACLTRGSLAPWPISSGLVIRRQRVQRRPLLQQLAALLGAGIADAAGQILEECGPIGRYRRQQRLEVGRADDVDAAAEHLRCKGEPGQRGIAAVGAAHDGDAPAIGNSLLHRPLHGVDQVVMHLAAPLQVAGVEECLAEAGGAAEIHRQHGIAAIGQPLVVRVIAVLVSCPRPAVHQKHHRQWPLGSAALAFRQGQI